LGQSSPPSQVKDIIFHARATGKSTRGTASKLYGIANFLEQGIYGRVGYGGPMAIKARQDETIAAMTPEIEACFEVIEAVMRFELKRNFSFSPAATSIFGSLRRCCRS